MACYHPRTLYRTIDGRLAGEPPAGLVPRPVVVVCRQCKGCRLEHSRQWAVRCMHEAQMHDVNSFVTFTYSDKNLPADRGLHLEHWQEFSQRLRNHLGSKDPTTGKFKPGKFRYYHCGEYGEQTDRPHYHALLFGLDFRSDRKHLTQTKHQHALFTSPTLDDLWGKGYCQIGNLTYESAGYVARYCMKKQTGKQEALTYGSRKPPYASMSRRPGIGKTWIDKYHTDVYPSDEVIVNGKSARPPSYYDDQLSDTKKELLKTERQKQARKHAHNNTPDRLAVREHIHEQRIKLLKRTL